MKKNWFRSWSFGVYGKSFPFSIPLVLIRVTADLEFIPADFERVVRYAMDWSSAKRMHDEHVFNIALPRGSNTSSFTRINETLHGNFMGILCRVGSKVMNGDAMPDSVSSVTACCQVLFMLMSSHLAVVPVGVTGRLPQPPPPRFLVGNAAVVQSVRKCGILFI